MKKLVYVLPVAVFILIAALFGQRPEREERTIRQFEADRTVLEELAEHILEQGSAIEAEPPAPWQKVFLNRGECPSVEIQFRSSGFASETTYWGVVYVPCGHTMYMKYFRNMSWETQENTETGILFFEPEGDNTCYVKRLDECWYYYEMSF